MTGGGAGGIADVTTGDGDGDGDGGIINKNSPPRRRTAGSTSSIVQSTAALRRTA
jgi:hypothetical protein